MDKRNETGAVRKYVGLDVHKATIDDGLKISRCATEPALPSIIVKGRG